MALCALEGALLLHLLLQLRVFSLQGSERIVRLRELQRQLCGVAPAASAIFDHALENFALIE